MHPRSWLWLAFLLWIGLAGCRPVDAQDGPLVTVYKSPTCGCCGEWAARMRAAGFRVREVQISAVDLRRLKDERQIPTELRSCHTAEVAGYLLEGHVPPQEVQRLLRERPAVRGLAVPNMPVGSPGMEVSDGAWQPYTVYTFDADGRVRAFAEYP